MIILQLNRCLYDICRHERQDAAPIWKNLRAAYKKIYINEKRCSVLSLLHARLFDTHKIFKRLKIVRGIEKISFRCVSLIIYDRTSQWGNKYFPPWWITSHRSVRWDRDLYQTTIILWKKSIYIQEVFDLCILDLCYFLNWINNSNQ